MEVEGSTWNDVDSWGCGRAFRHHHMPPPELVRPCLSLRLHSRERPGESRLDLQLVPEQRIRVLAANLVWNISSKAIVAQAARNALQGHRFPHPDFHKRFESHSFC
jgi:hypothetical protein